LDALLPPDRADMACNGATEQFCEAIPGGVTVITVCGSQGSGACPDGWHEDLDGGRTCNVSCDGLENCGGASGSTTNTIVCRPNSN
jgi:hypothetical protein